MEKQFGKFLYSQMKLDEPKGCGCGCNIVSATDTPIYKKTGMEKPYFIAAVPNIALRWVLNEIPEG
jgi:hypothetical protein